MKNDTNKYGIPNLGCLLGIVYQHQLALLGETLKECGVDVTPAEYLVMRVLYKSNGLQQCEIADTLGKDKAVICRTVKTLESKGLVTTEAVSHKCLKVFVSARGEELKSAIMAVARKRHDALADVLSPHELASLSSILNKLLNQHKNERN